MVIITNQEAVHRNISILFAEVKNMKKDCKILFIINQKLHEIAWIQLVSIAILIMPLLILVATGTISIKAFEAIGIIIVLIETIPFAILLLIKALIQLKYKQ